MTVAQQIIVCVVIPAFFVLAAALAVPRHWLPRWTRPRTPSTPEPAVMAAQHRAEDKADGVLPEAQYIRAFADTNPHIRLARLAERAAEANAELGGDT